MNFTDISSVKISTTLDLLADACKLYFKLKDIPLDPEDSKYDLVHICTGICDFLHIQGYGPAGRFICPHGHIR